MENKFKGYNSILCGFENEGRLRKIPEDRDNPDRVDLSSNDYLGLARKSCSLIDSFMQQCDASFSSSASRLLASRQKHFRDLEIRLKELYGKPSLLFNSGYHANVGIIAALSIPSTLILSDKLVHASIIDGIRLGKADNLRWNHNDISHLKRTVQKNTGKYDRIIIVAESIYSMDGDLVPLKEIVNLKQEFPEIIIYLDEAHGFGVRGERGLGLAEELRVLDQIDILIGTFGKACASEGAFAITPPLIHSYLVNTARPLIFSTAIAPINALWTLNMVNRIINMNQERERLRRISKDFRNFIVRITGCDNPSRSQIVPLIVGNASKAVRIADRLNENGIDALAIRRPTVPPGGERIRFSLNSSLTENELRFVMDVIEQILSENEN